MLLSGFDSHILLYRASVHHTNLFNLHFGYLFFFFYQLLWLIYSSSILAIFLFNVVKIRFFHLPHPHPLHSPYLRYSYFSHYNSYHYKKVILHVSSHRKFHLSPSRSGPRSRSSIFRIYTTLWSSCHIWGEHGREGCIIH